jgi:hypothetical protein
MVGAITNGLRDKVRRDGIKFLLGLAFPSNHNKAVVRRGKLDSCQVAAYLCK